jgi:hypothetical protein
MPKPAPGATSNEVREVKEGLADERLPREGGVARSTQLPFADEPHKPS